MLFTRAIVRRPGENFAEGLTSFKGEPPDYVKAIEQHEAYCAALEQCGLEVVRLAADLAHPDSTFVEDVAVLTRDTAILTRPGAKSREGEVDGIRDALGEFFQTVHEIEAPGTLDGGDICEAGKHFFIGVSRRTNEEGAGQLAAFLAHQGFTTSFVDMRAMKSILHLKSGIAWVGDGKLVVVDELAGREEFREYELIRVAAVESYAANCVRVNDFVLIPAGFPVIANDLIARGFKVLALEVSEFQKMDGGLSCLSLRF
ncbi:MAG TPA: arginine deiminase family protein [Candidatus Acidoferrales bacterium]